MDEANSSADAAAESASTTPTRSTPSSPPAGSGGRGLSRKLLWLVLLTFVLGAVGGGWIMNIWRGPAIVEEDEHDHADDQGLSPLQAMYRKRYEIFEVSHAARDTLGLRVEEAQVQPFTEVIRLPGVVREIPGRSDLTASTSPSGVSKVTDRSRTSSRGEDIKNGSGFRSASITP